MTGRMNILPLPGQPFEAWSGPGTGAQPYFSIASAQRPDNRTITNMVLQAFHADSSPYTEAITGIQLFISPADASQEAALAAAPVYVNGNQKTLSEGTMTGGQMTVSSVVFTINPNDHVVHSISFGVQSTDHPEIQNASSAVDIGPY